jgi:pterin-4a-carbinolamine dehydratase
MLNRVFKQIREGKKKIKLISNPYNHHPYICIQINKILKYQL